MRAPRTQPAAEPAPTVASVQPVEPPRAVNPTPNTPAGGGILTQVLPDIPRKARNTISGKVTVNVKVSVDQRGNVQAATIEPPRSSRYLSDLTVAAARRWKFDPGDAPREWLLRFQLFRDRTTVTPARLPLK